MSQRTRVSKESFMFKADIKDFYMRGDVFQMSDLIFEDAPQKCRQDMKRLLEHLMTNQYVRTRFMQSTWKVMQGSGMGLRHSGECADSFFYALCERPLLLNPAFTQQHNIELYIRFRDDMLIVGPRGLAAYARLHGAMSHKVRGTHQIDTEGYGYSEIDMLDLTLYKGKSFARNGRLQFKPRVRATSQKVPSHTIVLTLPLCCPVGQLLKLGVYA